MKKKPTMADVANKLGISTKSVSRALSHPELLKPETKAKIDQVMQEMEYFPSAAARALNGKTNDIIALITDNLTTTPDSYEIIKGIQSACHEVNKILMIGETGGSLTAFDKLINDFRKQGATAIIKATVSLQEIDIKQKITTCKFATINCFDKHHRYPSFIPDDEAGTYALTDSLIKNGHSKIAFLTLLPDMVATSLRVKGYTKALNHHNIDVDMNLIQCGISKPPDEFYDLEELIVKLLESHPTAIMFGNDKMAMRGYSILQNLRIKIPDDISVAGFDNYELIAQNLIPNLSTVNLPYFEMGYQATKMIINDEELQDKKIQCSLIKRDSIAKIN